MCCFDTASCSVLADLVFGRRPDMILAEFDSVVSKTTKFPRRSRLSECHLILSFVPNFADANMQWAEAEVLMFRYEN